MIVKHIKSKIYYVCLMVFMASLLQGCSSDDFVQKQAEVVVGKGSPVIEEYVRSLSNEAHITGIRMIYGGKQGEPSFSAKLPSSIVQADFSVGDARYIAVVNVEDGEVYSNYDYIDPNEMIQKQLIKYCDEYGFDGTYSVSGAFYSYAFVSHQVEVNKGDIRDVYVYIDNIPDLSPVNISREYTNASISGFDIEYESEYDEVFRPEILYKYLSDTGNYRKEQMRGDDREYHINGGRQVRNYVNGDPSYYEMNIISEGNPDTMTCDVCRWDYKEEDCFSYLYVGGAKSGNIKSIDKEEYVEYSCPFTLGGNELTYIRDDNSPYEGYLYVKNPEWNEIVMTRYKLTNKSLGEKSNDIVDKWELEQVEQNELEAVKSDFANLFELYIKGTMNKCEFTDDKAVIVFN